VVIERVSHDTATEVEAADFRQRIMQKNQIRLKPEALPHSRLFISRRKYFVVMVL
jgi:hypothetical protein